MSQFTDHAKERIKKLTNYMFGLINGEDGKILIERYNIITENFIPADILPVFDNLFKQRIQIEDIKKASNKLFNILYKTLNEYPKFEPAKGSYLYYLKADNDRIKVKLNEIKPDIKKINQSFNQNILISIKNKFEELLKIDIHYRSKENVLFPYIEMNFEHSDCLKLMWSIHDDIRSNIKSCIQIVSNENFDLDLFNKVSAKIFFNINTIIFREEKVLIPVLMENTEPESIERLLYENKDICFSFISEDEVNYSIPKIDKEENNEISLLTGNLRLEQLELIFKNLPVDITFVDENDKVRFYSDPPHRIFPRTKSIIGRSVQNCHPPESIDVVNEIVYEFKTGSKDHADFWIQLHGKFILIRYFAVRDENNNYKGTLEVSQEISEIRKLKGERKLLNW